MDDDIFAALERGEARSQEVSTYFSAELECNNPDRVKKLCRYALKIFYTYATNFTKFSQSEVGNISQAIADCCHFIKTKSTNGTDSQTAAKSLYHIINNALKKRYFEDAIRVSKSLKTLLIVDNQEADPTTNSIGGSAYPAFWNASYKLENESTADPHLCLQLSGECLEYLLLTDKPIDKVHDKITWTISHFRTVFSKMKLDSKAANKACEAMDGLVRELSGVISYRERGNLSPEESAGYTLIVLDMHLDLLTFLITQRGHKLCASVVDRLMGHLNSTKETQCNSLSNFKLVLSQLIDAGIYLSAFTENSTSEGNERSSDSQIIGALDNAGAHLKTVAKKIATVQQVKMLHQAVRFSLQLPEYGIGGGRRFDYKTMTAKLEEEVLNFYGVASSFYTAVCKTTQKLNDKILMDVLRYSHLKVLQYKLEAVGGQLNSVKESTELQTHLAPVTADLVQFEAVVRAQEAAGSKKQALAKDLQLLAHFSYKFGRVYFQRGLNLEAAEFMKRCIAQNLQLTKDTGTTPPANLNVWKPYEVLADCQRRCGMFESALNTVAEGVLADASHLSNALCVWCRNKVEIAKASPDKLNTRSLWSYIEAGVGPSVSATSVLNAEFNTYKESRSPNPDLVLPLIDELLAVSPSRSADRAGPLLEKVALLWASRKQDHTAVLSICTEVIELLEGQLTSKKARQPAVLNDLARAYFWHHVVANVDPMEIRDKLKDVQAAGGKSKEAYHDCCTLDMEHQAAKMADRALQLWEEVVGFTSVPSTFKKQYLTSTIHWVSTLVDYYRLTLRTGEELRCLLVLSRLCEPTMVPLQYLRAQTELVKWYCRLHQPRRALPLVTALTDWLQTAETCHTTPQHVNALLATAATLIQDGQVNEGCAMLNKAIKVKSEHFRPKSTDALTLDGSIWPLVATVASVPPGHHDPNHGDCCLSDDLEDVPELQVKGTRSISGVVSYMMGEWLAQWKVTSDKVPQNTLSKWALLNEQLTLLLSTGVTYAQLGDAHEAKCYLTHGLKLAEAFQLPRRFAEFHLELSWLDSISDKFTDGQSHINVASYTLNSTEPPPNVSEKTTPVKRKRPSGKRSVGQEEDSDDDMIIQTRPIEVPELLEDGETSPHVIGSPTARRWKPSAPAQWLHPEDCDCSGCFDVTGQGLKLKHLAQQAYCLCQQGLHSQAQAFWNLFLKNIDTVNRRLGHGLLKLLGPENKVGEQNGTKVSSKREKKAVKIPSKSKTKKSEPFVIYDDESNQVKCELPIVDLGVHLRMWVEVCHHTAQLSLSQQNWSACEEMVSKAEELLYRDNYPRMISYHAGLVENICLKSVPALRLPTVVQKTDLEELFDKLSVGTTVSTRKTGSCSSTSDIAVRKAQVTKTKTATSSRGTMQRKVTSRGDKSKLTVTPSEKQDLLSPAKESVVMKSPKEVQVLSPSNRPLVSGKTKTGTSSRATGQRKALNTVDKSKLTVTPCIKQDQLSPAKERVGLKSPKEVQVLSPSNGLSTTTKTKNSTSTRGIGQRKALGTVDKSRLTVTPSIKLDLLSPAKEGSGEVQVLSPSNIPSVIAKTKTGTSKRVTSQRKALSSVDKSKLTVTSSIKKDVSSTNKSSTVKSAGEVRVLSPSNRPSTATKTKTATSTRGTMQRKVASRGDKSKLTVTSSIKQDLLSPAKSYKENGVIKSSREVRVLSDSNRTPIKPKQVLVIGSENVFDFIPSSPEETPLAARGKKKPGKPGRNPGTRRVRKAVEVPPDVELEIKRGPQEVPRRSRLFVRQVQPLEDTVVRKQSEQVSPTLDPPPCSPKEALADLDRAFALCRHRPTPILYRQLCHCQVLARLAQPSPDPWDLAFYLGEAQSVTFRHKVLGSIGRKMRTLREETDGGMENTNLVQRLTDMRTALRFGQEVSDLRSTIDCLPADWTVVHVSVMTLVGQPRGRLVVTRFAAGQDPVVVHLPGFATNQGQKLLSEFSEILKSNNATMALTNKSEWWSQRTALDEKLKELLETLEGRWLGWWLGLFMGRPDNEEDARHLDQSAEQLTTYLQEHVKTDTVSTARVKLLLRAHHLLAEQHVVQFISELCDVKPNDDAMADMVAKTSSFAKSLNLEATPKCRPVILVLDRALQHLPWESLPCLLGQPVTRVPSVHFLRAHLTAHREDTGSVFQRGVDLSNTYYVLNPDDNLDSTQATFEAKFKSEPGWSGIVGQPPSTGEFTEGVTQHDLFVYCGHGGGSKYLPGLSLAALQCRAAVVLMGCSSGRLTVDGQLEAAGLMLNYFLAGCPTLVACLWDVTDRDIDRYLQELLGRWQRAEPGTSILHAVHESRTACRLPYLIGAAPAVYGLPLNIGTKPKS